MNDQDQAGLGWTVVLRRQPARIVEGRSEGGYTGTYKLVCCDCGDHPGLDYCEVSPDLRQIRGPYPFAAGIAAYERHVSRATTGSRQPPLGPRDAIAARPTRLDDPQPVTAAW